MTSLQPARQLIFVVMRKQAFAMMSRQAGIALLHHLSNFHRPHNCGVSMASLGTSAVMAVALLLQ